MKKEAVGAICLSCAEKIQGTCAAGPLGTTSVSRPVLSSCSQPAPHSCSAGKQQAAPPCSFPFCKIAEQEVIISPPLSQIQRTDDSSQV